MRDDLQFALASVDWAEASLPSLHQRFQSWCDANMRIVTVENDGDADTLVVLAVETEPVPLSFSVEVGAYINAFRSSLDMLAVALVTRYGKGRPDKAYKGKQFVEGLPPGPRAKIKALRPYKGGNSLLALLHDLDIERKHKRLLTVEPRPLSAYVASNRFTPVSRPVSVNGETVLGFIPKGGK